jgi:RNase P/RNase MRP subunit p30
VKSLRKFVDLHVSPPIEEFSRTEDLISLAAQLGFNTVGIATSGQIQSTALEKCFRICKEHGVEGVKRVNLKPESAEELIKRLRSVRGIFDVVAVNCETKTVARQAAKDRRVDVLNFPYLRYGDLFDEAEAQLASSSNATLEINIVDIVKTQRPLLPKVFLILHRRLAAARKHDIPIIVSSGAKIVYDLHAPRDLASLMQCFGLSKYESLNSVSTTPMELIRRNREKFSPSYVSLGVKLVEEGER